MSNESTCALCKESSCINGMRIVCDECYKLMVFTSSDALYRQMWNDYYMANIEEAETLENQIRFIAYKFWQVRTGANAQGTASSDWTWAENAIKQVGYEKALAAIVGSPGAWPIVVS